MKRILQVFVGLTVLLGLSPAFAKILSISSQEMKIQVDADFITSDVDNLKADAEELVEMHYQHLFGYFHSPHMVRLYGLNPATNEGLAAVRMPLKIKVISDTKHSGQRYIHYQATGLAIVNQHAAQKIFSDRKIDVHLPYDLDNFYDINCTDSEYNTVGDFWYFYDPYRKGCEHLLESPLVKPVVVKVLPVAIVTDQSANLEKIRSDNDNGSVFEIVTVNGFAENSHSSRDDGRVSFQHMNAWLKSLGFEEKILDRKMIHPLYQYSKWVTDQKGNHIQIVINRLLADTAIESRSNVFAQFFKEKIETADVIIYAGHSGLGGNLSIPDLEEKVGAIQFNPNKRQILYWDGCSTYSYYLTPFEEAKTRSKVDIITNGVSSLFDSEVDMHKVFLSYLIDVNNNPSWKEILISMEKAAGGPNYMLSVGSL